MRPDARVRLGSLSKTWLATLILKLVGQGRMRLDDTVARWLPGLLPYGNQITIRELLEHTSGMVDSNDISHDPNRYLGEVKDPTLRARFLAVASRLAKDPGYEFSPRLWVEFAAALPLRYPPGTTFHYSNIGYDVAGLVAEHVGGADLATLFRRLIIDPLHLASAAYDPHSQITGTYAHGYHISADGKLTDATSWTQGVGAGGGMISDAADEARFLQALMRGEIIDTAQLDEMKTPPAFGNYGLGISIDRLGSGGSTGCPAIGYGHNGGMEGFETNVYVSGDGTRVAVLLLNGRTWDDHGDTAAYTAMEFLFCAA
jgi:D-alanyl-D-alanine carboxypeptidase